MAIHDSLAHHHNSDRTDDKILSFAELCPRAFADGVTKPKKNRRSGRGLEYYQDQQSAVSTILEVRYALVMQVGILN